MQFELFGKSFFRIALIYSSSGSSCVFLLSRKGKAMGFPFVSKKLFLNSRNVSTVKSVFVNLPYLTDFYGVYHNRRKSGLYNCKPLACQRDFKSEIEARLEA